MVPAQWITHVQIKVENIYNLVVAQKFQLKYRIDKDSKAAKTAHNTDKYNYFDPDTQRNPRLRSLPYHIDQIHLASNYLLASFTLSIAKKSEEGWQLRSDPIYKPTGSSIPFDP